jgi:hypothetical protein
MEIWKGWKGDSISYCLYSSNVKILDKKIGLVNYADMDRDGFIDLVFPIVDDKIKSTISIVYNQIKNDIDWSSDYCKERKKDLNKKIQIFPDLKVDIIDNLNNQIYIKLKSDGNLNFYSNENQGVYPLMRIGKTNALY